MTFWRKKSKKIKKNKNYKTNNSTNTNTYNHLKPQKISIDTELSIQKERDAMEKLWKAREKQLDKVLLSAAHIRGSIEGIAGSDTIQLNLTDDEDALLLE